MKALVIGASGGFGGAVARELMSRGVETYALVRPGGRTIEIPGIWEVTGDALDAEAVARAAQGMDVIVHGFNLPYSKWEPAALRAVEIVAEVAADINATVLFPGNLYGFGPELDQPLTEEAPRQAPSHLGELRNRMEATLACAASRGARVIILRAGDYFGPGADNTWFSMVVKRTADGGPILDPCERGVPHTWAFLPDLAYVAAELLKRADRLAPYEEVHFEGHVLTPEQLVAGLRVALGDPSRKVRHFPWWVLALVAPFSGTMRALRSLRYLWQQPVRLDNTKLCRLLGAEPRTALIAAFRQTLNGEVEQPSPHHGAATSFAAVRC